MRAKWRNDLYRKLIKNKPDCPWSYNDTYKRFYKEPKRDISFTNLTTEAETLKTDVSRETIWCVSLINSKKMRPYVQLVSLPDFY